MRKLILESTKGHRWLYLLGVFFSSLVVLLTLLIPPFVGRLAEILTEGKLGIRDILPVLGIWLARQAFCSLQTLTMGIATMKTVGKLRLLLLREVLGKSMAFFGERHSANLSARIITDVEIFLNAIYTWLGYVISDIFIVAGLGVYLFVKNTFLTAVFSGVIALVFFVILRFGTVVQRASHRRQKALGGLAETVQEILSSISTIKTVPNTLPLFRKVSERTEAYSKAFMRYALAGALFVPASATLMGLGVLLFFVVVGKMLVSGRISPADLGSYVFAWALILDPISRISNHYGQFKQALGALRRCEDILRGESEPSEGTPVERIKGHIRFENVRFKYPGQKSEALKGATFEIMPGEKVAIVGKIGSGKSTLLYLLMRFFDGYSGTITIDGKNLRDLEIKSLRERIGYFPQKVELFDLTVAENIALGKPNATFEEIVEAAKRAGAHEFIMSLPQGYDTRIGEGGKILSGGQRQAIALARLFLKDPDIVLLDEPTSALDPASEDRIKKALARLIRGKTAIIVTHRYGILDIADRVLRMDDGTIEEARECGLQSPVEEQEGTRSLPLQSQES